MISSGSNGGPQGDIGPGRRRGAGVLCGSAGSVCAGRAGPATLPIFNPQIHHVWEYEDSDYQGHVVLYMLLYNILNI